MGKLFCLAWNLAILGWALSFCRASGLQPAVSSLPPHWPHQRPELQSKITRLVKHRYTDGIASLLSVLTLLFVPCYERNPRPKCSFKSPSIQLILLRRLLQPSSLTTHPNPRKKEHRNFPSTENRKRKNEKALTRVRFELTPLSRPRT